MDRKKVGIGVGVLAVLAVAAWALGYFNGTDPQVAELQQMRDENFQRMGQMTDEQRRAQFQQFREKVDQLSDAQRREFFESSRDMFQARMLDRMNQFFELSPKEQQKELDERIDRMEQWRKEREARGDQGGGPPRASGRGGPPGGGRRGGGGKARLDRSSPEMRAKMARYFEMLNARREQRGLDPIGGGRGRFWFGRPPG